MDGPVKPGHDIQGSHPHIRGGHPHIQASLLPVIPGLDPGIQEVRGHAGL